MTLVVLPKTSHAQMPAEVRWKTGRQNERREWVARRNWPDYLVTLRALSFTSPATFWIVPFALSAFPSACIFLLPVTLPTASFTAPLALLKAPLTCSRAIIAPNIAVQKGINGARILKW